MLYISRNNNTCYGVNLSFMIAESVYIDLCVWRKSRQWRQQKKRSVVSFIFFDYIEEPKALNWQSQVNTMNWEHTTNSIRFFSSSPCIICASVSECDCVCSWQIFWQNSIARLIHALISYCVKFIYYLNLFFFSVSLTMSLECMIYYGIIYIRRIAFAMEFGIVEILF